MERIMYDKENNIELTKEVYQDSIYFGVKTAINGYYNEIKINTGLSYSKTKGWEFNLGNIDLIKEKSPQIYEYLMTLPGLQVEINTARQLGATAWFGEEKQNKLKNANNLRLIYDKENNIELRKTVYDDSVHFSIKTPITGYYNEIKINTGLSYSETKGWEFNLGNIEMIRQKSPQIYEYLMTLPGLQDEINTAIELGVSTWFGNDKMTALENRNNMTQSRGGLGR